MGLLSGVAKGLTGGGGGGGGGEGMTLPAMFGGMLARKYGTDAVTGALANRKKKKGGLMGGLMGAMGLGSRIGGVAGALTGLRTPRAMSTTTTPPAGTGGVDY